MPLYNYKRSDGEIITLKHGMTSERPTICPDTGLPIKRTFEGMTFSMGWVQTREAADGSKLSKPISQAYMDQLIKAKPKMSEERKHELNERKKERKRLAKERDRIVA